MILRTAKKKASIDAMLNSGITKQLEDVRCGLLSFTPTLEDIEEVKSEYHGMSENLSCVSDLVKSLSELQEESKQYAELKIAMKNIDQILKLPENVAKANQFIDDGQLLQASYY